LASSFQNLGLQQQRFWFYLTLKSYNMLTPSNKRIISRLLAEIEDGSLQNILRRVIFEQDKESFRLLEILKTQRPHLTNEDVENLAS
jgi:hypothetical protein